MALADRLVLRSSGVRFRLKKDDNISSLSHMASPFWSIPNWQLAL
jgi:hypothetical protein